jgi:hypothetical protein
LADGKRFQIIQELAIDMTTWRANAMKEGVYKRVLTTEQYIAGAPDDPYA